MAFIVGVSMGEERVRVDVNQIGEYIQRGACPRRFKLDLNSREEAMKLPFFARTLNPLDPVLQRMGRELEERWERSLLEAGMIRINDLGHAPLKDQISWEEFVELVEQHCQEGGQQFGREVAITCQKGRFEVHGRMDFVIVLWRDGRPYLRIVECKASRKDKTYHRLQLALYLLMVRSLLERRPLLVAGKELTCDSVEGVVARMREAGGGVVEDRIMDLEPLDLSTEMEDARRLLSDGGILEHISSSELEELSYQINAKCDSCVFNVCCLPESARRRSIELLGLDVSVTSTLREKGIRTLDELAALKVDSPLAHEMRRTPGFSQNLENLIARARARLSTLPGSKERAFQVQKFPHASEGQLPPHDIEGRRLVRVYVAVEYDYIEDRIVALAAHVTSSCWNICTPFRRRADGGWAPHPKAMESPPRTQQSMGGQEEREVQGEDVIRLKEKPWSGKREEDERAERELMERFLSELMISISRVAETDKAPVHFYFWSRSDFDALLGGCARCGSDLLDSLTHLLGCREPLEQLIYSCLEEEVHSRYGTGWTGRGLVVATSVKWFGQAYHWTREVEGRRIRLDDLFRQDLFDFRGRLRVRPDGEWAREGEPFEEPEFEIRSRFHDGLPIPYWHAVWGTLPPIGPEMRRNHREALEGYSRVNSPKLIQEYLRARVHAMRWLEERIIPKNRKLRKAFLDLRNLSRFRLAEPNSIRAAVDFLRLDHHVRLSDWLVRCMQPVRDRVAKGETVPIAKGTIMEDGSDVYIEAKLDLERFGEDGEGFWEKSLIEQESWVRLTIYDGDASKGQSPHQLFSEGCTCKVQGVDAREGKIFLKAMRFEPDRYRLFSKIPRDGFEFAVLDESISDMVATRVEGRLLNEASSSPSVALSWFDILRPSVPPLPCPPEEELEKDRRVLEGMIFEGKRLGKDQIEAIMEGLVTRVHLLLGPPGTGKTTTLAAATLLRASKLPPGEVLAFAASTHAAVDRLMEELNRLLPSFLEVYQRAHGVRPDLEILDWDEAKSARASASRLNELRRVRKIILGGTTNEVLKLCGYMCQLPPFNSRGEGFTVRSLVVDEASMMVMPHFLALASILSAEGCAMLAGDHNQLSPILSHQWEEEDRPYIQLYQPYTSAYDAVASLSRARGIEPSMIRRSALVLTFRLPYEIRTLIDDIYRRDGVELEGAKAIESRRIERDDDVFGLLWRQGGIFLILHSESGSKKLNRFEASIIEELVRRGTNRPPGSLAVMTPHRAQRTLLQSVLRPYLTEGDVIDTVERLQGGERPTVIVSGTQSDPTAISNSADFILYLNRTNVIFSRARERLIVVCARTLLDSVPADKEMYENAMLWKKLRALCSRRLLWFRYRGHEMEVLLPDLDNIELVGANPECDSYLPSFEPKPTITMLNPVNTGQGLLALEGNTEQVALANAPEALSEKTCVEKVERRRARFGPGPPPIPRIVVDGSNLARYAGYQSSASARNLIKAYEDLISEFGFRSVHVVVGAGLWRSMPREEWEQMTKYFHEEASKRGRSPILLQAPAGVNDDVFIIGLALNDDCLILSNDLFRDHIQRHPEWEVDINMRLVKYMFVEDKLRIEEWPDYQI
ncbi:MAG: AAA family ATPase [Methanomassiliicoccales archaeon]